MLPGPYPFLWRGRRCGPIIRAPAELELSAIDVDIRHAKPAFWRRGTISCPQRLANGCNWAGLLPNPERCSKGFHASPVTQSSQIWATDLTPDQVWRRSSIAMVRSFVCRIRMDDWFRRRVLAWLPAITLETNFYIEDLKAEDRGSIALASTIGIKFGGRCCPRSAQGPMVRDNRGPFTSGLRESLARRGFLYHKMACSIQAALPIG